MHWARDCPCNEGDTTKEVEITMVNVDEHITSNFVRGTFNSDILDSGCTSTVKLGDTKVKIFTDVIRKDLPLLLSNDSMKTARTVLCFASDSVEMFGYCILIWTLNDMLKGL